MEELDYLFSYQENFDELNQKLLFTTVEPETVKMEVSEELRKQKEEMKHLLKLLKAAYLERDEAIDQLQKLRTKLMHSDPIEFQPSSILAHVQHESSLAVVPTKANSSITESNSQSDTYNPQLHGSSPGDSFLDAASSPDFSNINMADSRSFTFVNQPFAQEFNSSIPTGLVSSVVTKTDPFTAVLDSLVKGKTLPPKGRLLQSVMEAGPLLKTLLIAGPLPQWRNPPPLQPFRIPPLIKGSENISFNQKPAANSSCVAQRSLNSLSSYLQMSCASSQMCSTSMPNFSTCPAAVDPQSNGMLLTAGAFINTQLSTSKRQRFQY